MQSTVAAQNTDLQPASDMNSARDEARSVAGVSPLASQLVSATNSTQTTDAAQTISAAHSTAAGGMSPMALMPASDMSSA